MLKKSEKLLVYTVIRKNENGFTLISMLFMLAILAFSLPFLAYLIKSISYTSNFDEIAGNQFFQFLRDDVSKAIDYHVESSRLTLIIDEDTTVTIEKYKDLIRRQVNKEGHEIYLQAVKELTFTAHPYGVQTTVTSLQGERYEKTIIFYE